MLGTIAGRFSAMFTAGARVAMKMDMLPAACSGSILKA
jgi:hypothetical protein